MVRIWLTSGFGELDDEVKPIVLFIIKPLGVTLRIAYITMLCYARRRGLGLSEIHDRCEIVKLMVQLKVAT